MIPRNLIGFSVAVLTLVALSAFSTAGQEKAKPPALPLTAPRTIIEGFAQFGQLIVSNDGKTLLSTTQASEAVWWDIADGKLIRKLPVASTPTCLAATRDGKVIATGSPTNVLTVWYLEDVPRKLVLKNGGQTVTTVSFHPDGKSAAYGDVAGKINFWDVGSGKVLASPNVGLSGGTQILYGPAGGCLLASSQDGASFVLSENGKSLLDISRPPKSAPRDQPSFVSASFSPDGRSLAVCYKTNSIYLWDIPNAKPLKEFTAHLANAIRTQFSPDGKLLASTSADRSVILWDVTTAKVVHTLVGHTGTTFHLAFSQDGRTLASTGADNIVRIWDVDSGKALAIFAGHKGSITRLAFAGNKTVVTGSTDQTIALWDIPSVQKQ